MPKRCQFSSEEPERGAVLVEFALALPFLLIFLFGIVEFGAAYSQNLDVRHGAREGSRLAAVDFNPYDEDPLAQLATLVATICERMDESTDATVDITYAVAGSQDVGDVVVVDVAREYSQITGFLDAALGGVTLTSSVSTRLEQDASFDGSQGPQPC